MSDVQSVGSGVVYSISFHHSGEPQAPQTQASEDLNKSHSKTGEEVLTTLFLISMARD